MLQQRKRFKTCSRGRLALTVIGAAIGENTAEPTIAYDDTDFYEMPVAKLRAICRICGVEYKRVMMRCWPGS